MSTRGTYSIPSELIGFEDSDVQHLKRNFARQGLKFQQPQLGAGDSNLITQIIAWLDVHPFAASLTVAAAVPITQKLFGVVREWYKQNPPKKISKLEVTNIIHIRFRNQSKSFDLELDVSRDYSPEEISYEIALAVKRDENDAK